MGLASGGAGDDRLQVGMAVFAVVMSLMVTMMLPIVAPSYDSETGYSYADIYAEKASLEAYTGQSMVNMAPWRLTGVYTAWHLGSDSSNIDPETGWAYGEEISGYPYIGQTSEIKLLPNQKSDRPLMYATVPVQVTQGAPASWAWWAFGLNGTPNIFGLAATTLFGAQIYDIKTVTQDVNTWSFSGYRYEFDPMLKIDYSDPDAADYSKVSQSDAKLSIVWYTGQSYGSGLSGGLILYNNTSNGIVSNISMEDIIADYKAGNYSTRYSFDFNGVQLYLNFRYDLDVQVGTDDLREAFDAGRWTIAITALSTDNLMDIGNSNSLSSSMANLLDTYIKIYTMSFPGLDTLWSMVLWVICILPLNLTVIMFLSRLGFLGLGIGVLGSSLLLALGLSV